MKPDEYRRAVDRLGVSIVGIAPELGIARRTSQRYASGEAAIPTTVRKLLELMVAITEDRRLMDTGERP
jgi:hypothetical protein